MTVPEQLYRHETRETADKVRLSVKLKRGTGTRDQDTFSLKARGENAMRAADELETLVNELQSREIFDDVRAIQPPEGDS
jgi:hypothetical protein